MSVNVDLQPGVVNFALTQGDPVNSSVVQLRLTDEDGNPFNLTGVTLSGGLRRAYSGNKSALVKSWNLQVIDAAEGLIAPDMQTDDLRGEYVHTICASGGDVPDRTYMQGKVSVIERSCD